MSEQALWVRMRCDRAQVLVVGGGRVAARKVEKFLRAGAHVEVIAPVLCDALKARLDLITWRERAFTEDDVTADVDFAIVATDVASINARVARLCMARGVPVNVADGSAPSTFHLPASRRHGPVEWALFLGGASPALTVQLMARIEALLVRDEPWWAQAATMLGTHREAWMRAHRAKSDRSKRWRALSARVVERLRSGDRPEEVEAECVDVSSAEDLG